MSTQWNKRLSRYVFSKAIEILEQNIWKQIDCKRLSSTKQISRVHITWIKIYKKKYDKVRGVLAVFASTCLWIILSNLGAISK